MSAPITDAHKQLWTTLYNLAHDEIFDVASSDGPAHQLIADSDASAVASAVNTLTCTHHNDQMRAACPVCLVATLTAERDQLRAVFPQICAAIGNGAFCMPTVSVGFIESIPNEVQLVVAELRARAERAEAELAAERDKAERYRLATLKLDAELATKRARLDDLVADINDACITLESAKDDCDDYAMQNTAFKLTAVRDVLLQYIPNSAMKEAAK